MNTSEADVLAVLETDATTDASTAPGNVDDAAQKLIERARAAGWQALAIPETNGQPAYTIVYDGSGRYRYERVLPEGLREQVVCDGKTIVHLYPELGIGARRTVSRFHRAELGNLISEALPPVEDLARGHDLKAIDANTVAILPRNPSTPAADGKPARSTVIHLVFAPDGRLAERRALAMPEGKTLYRELFKADGSATLLDVDGKVEIERRSVRQDAAAPDLAPDVKKLVILPLPYRTWQHLWATKAQNKGYQNLDEPTALGLIGSALNTNMAWQAWQVYQQRFHNKGVRLVGFQTLLAASGLQHQQPQFWEQAAKQHPQEPLSRYFAMFDPKRPANTPLGDIGAGKDSFLQRLAGFRDMVVLWNSGKALEGGEAKRNAERARALEYIRANRTSVHGWAILSLLREKLANDKASQKQIAEACKLFENTPGLAYAAQYEYARSLFKDGQTDRARSLWLALYERTLQESGLPLIDADFRTAMQSGKEAPQFRDLVRKTAASLIEKDRRVSVIALATQCRQLDELALADDLIADALKGVSDKDRLATTLAAIEYYWQSGQNARADELLQALLATRDGEQNASLWHLASAMATHQRKLGRAVVCLDNALEIEYRHLPKLINVQAVRHDYGRLLNAYQQVAFALNMLDRQPDREFVTKVVRVADRWRALDPDSTLACQTAARILKSVGAGELAWDYLTTPCALHPNEAAPHLQLAQTLQQEGDIDLAHQAYTIAFEAEPTNVQILWQHAQMLQQAGRHADALTIYRKIADGNWPPNFQWLKQQARGQLGVR